MSGWPKWQQFALRHRGEILFAVGTMSSPVANLIAGIVSARCLKPAEMGVFTTAALLPAYLGFLQLGVFAGLSRNLPLELGAGRPERGDALVRTSGGAATLVGLAGAVICLVAALVSVLRDEGRMMTWTLAATALTVFGTAITTHVDTALRGLHRFGQLSAMTLGANFLTAVSSVLIAGFGATGALVRIAVCAVGALLLRLWSKVWSPLWRVDWPDAVALGRTGLPLLVSGAFFSFLMVADRSVVALLMTKEDVGHFALAGLLVNSLQFVPQSISLILFPKMARHYGANRSSRALRRFLLLNLLFNVVTIIPISLLCLWGVEPLVLRFFPAYAAGIPAAKIACLTSLCWIYLGVGSVIGVVNRMVPYLTAMALVLLLIWGLGAYLISTGHGIEGAAWARGAGTLALCVFTIAYSFYLTSVEMAPAEPRGSEHEAP